MKFIWVFAALMAMFVTGESVEQEALLYFCDDKGTLFQILLSTSGVITLNHVFSDLNDVLKMCLYMSYGEDFLGFFIFCKVKSASNQKSQSFLRLYCS